MKHFRNLPIHIKQIYQSHLTEKIKIFKIFNVPEISQRIFLNFSKNVVQKLCTFLDKLEKMKSTLEHNPFQLGVRQNIANFKLKWPAMPHMQAMRWEEKKSDIISFMRSFCVNVIWKWSDHRANIRLARRTRISLSNRRSLINFNTSISAPPSLFVFIAKIIMSTGMIDTKSMRNHPQR